MLDAMLKTNVEINLKLRTFINAQQLPMAQLFLMHNKAIVF